MKSVQLWIMAAAMSATAFIAFVAVVLLIILTADDPRRWGRDGRDLKRVSPRTGEVYYLREVVDPKTGEVVGLTR